MSDEGNQKLETNRSPLPVVMTELVAVVFCLGLILGIGGLLYWHSHEAVTSDGVVVEEKGRGERRSSGFSAGTRIDNLNSSASKSVPKSPLKSAEVEFLGIGIAGNPELAKSVSREGIKSRANESESAKMSVVYLIRDTDGNLRRSPEQFTMIHEAGKYLTMVTAKSGTDDAVVTDQVGFLRNEARKYEAMRSHVEQEVGAAGKR